MRYTRQIANLVKSAWTLSVDAGSSIEALKRGLREGLNIDEEKRLRAGQRLADDHLRLVPIIPDLPAATRRESSAG